MFGWFRGKLKPAGANPIKLERVDRHSIPGERDWKATNNDQPTAVSHWGRANGQDINSVLLDNLESMIDRATFEARANSIVDGTINNHANDVVGSNGPKLQVESGSDIFNKRAEAIWQEVSESIDGSGDLSLAELLKQDIRGLWTAGAILSQYVNDSEVDTLCTQRLHPIAVRRLWSGMAPTRNKMLGISRNDLGRATMYHVLEMDPTNYGIRYWLTPIDIPARDMQHIFYKHEPQQWRGYPWLASSLQTLAELDELDEAVRDAAKTAAIMHVLMYNTRDDVDSKEDPEPVRLRRQSINKLPTGWQAQALNSNQPQQNYVEFRNENLRDLGRPVGMPLMSLQRDASKHNYSSARFDGQGYARANQSVQAKISQKRLNPFVHLIFTEAMLRGELRYKDRRDIKLIWQWEKPPHVDPVKEAMAQRIRMENKTTSPQRECMADSGDFETIVAEWKRANEIFKANGLPEMLGSIPSNPVELAAMLQADQAASSGDSKNDNSNN